MLHKNKKIAVSSIILIFLTLLVFVVKDSNNNEFKSVWEETYDNPDEVIKSILETSVMKRLKSIDQSGPARYFGPLVPAFSRYDHSIGVWALLKKTGAPLNEQVAGLLHDSSHTVFSHLGDFIFAKNMNDFTQKSYQDTIHMQFLKDKPQLEAAIKKFGINMNDLDPDNNHYKRLEQPLPDMCADRIQYNIHTGVIFKRISKSSAKKIYDDIKFENGKWFFTDENLAKKFAELSLYFTQNFWGAPWDISLNMHLTNVLKRALELKLITAEDLFLTDHVVLNKLEKNQDRTIQINLEQCKSPLEKIPGKEYKTVVFKPKFRGIDPLVKSKKTGKMQRLTEIDSLFKTYYDSVKDWCKKGTTIDVLV